MEKFAKKQNEQTLLRLMTIAAFLLLFAFVFATAPAYAPGANPDTVIDPGGPPIASTIDGTIIDCSTGRGVPGMLVNLYVTRFYMMTTTTNSEGVFHFHDSGIQWFSDYVVTVNGEESMLGYYLPNVQYGQMRVIAHTDRVGYANLLLHLEPGAVVNVPAGATFSNTMYASLSYGTTERISHDMTFKVNLPFISIGYIGSKTIDVTQKYEYSPLTKAYIGLPHFAASYWDDMKPGGPGIVATGISSAVPNQYWQSFDTQEYVDPQGLEGDSYWDFQVLAGETDTWTYKETGSTTWQAGFGAGLGLEYEAWGVSLGLEIEVSNNSSKETWVQYVVHNNTTDTLYFRAYTPGGMCDPDNHKGGMELHIWEKTWE